MRFRHAFSFATAFGIGLLACGSDDSASPASSATTLSAEARAFVGELCAVASACCTGASSCTETAGALGLGKTFDPAMATTCLGELRTAAAGAAFCDRAPDVFACEAVFKSARTVAAGAACSSSADCANEGGAFGLCIGSGANARCRDVTRGKPGDPCVGTRANGTTADLAGAAAGATALCFLADDLQCDAKTKRCTERGAAGADCDPANEAACSATTYCPVDTRQCTPRAKAGDACSESDGCVLEARCAAGTDTASCVPWAKAGEPCPRGDECDPLLTCDSATATCTADTTTPARICSGQSPLGL